jgi:outer membrane protein TolC
VEEAAPAGDAVNRLDIEAAEEDAVEISEPSEPDPEGPASAEAGRPPLFALPPVLDLETSKRIALRDNPGLDASRQRVEAARQRVRQAQSAWLPTVFFNGAASNTWISENDYKAARNQALWTPITTTAQQIVEPTLQAVGMGQTNALLSAANSLAEATANGLAARRAVDNDLTTYSALFEAQWVLFDGFSRKFNVAATRFNRMEFEAAHLEAQRLLLSAVASAYYSAALAREELTIAQADEAFNLRQLNDAQARRRVGTGSLSDELNFEVRVNNARSEVIRATRSHELALIGLAELMALPAANMPDRTELAPLGEDPPEMLAQPEADALINLAIEERPDLARDEFAIARTGAEAKARKGEFLPDVSVFARRQAVLTEDGLPGQDDFDSTVGLNVSYEIYTGGRRMARYREAQALRREAEYLASESALAVASEVREAVENLAAAQKQLFLQRANAQFVQRNRELVEKEYDAGQASLVRLNEAQRDLIAQQGQLALARVTLRQAWHDLLTATGEVLDPFVGPQADAPEPADVAEEAETEVAEDLADEAVVEEEE